MNKDDYALLLEDPKWKALRERILTRDNRACHECSRPGFQRVLQIHHKYYQLGKAPWEYPDSAFVTLCAECHQTRHRISKPRIFDENGVLIENAPSCARCGGNGYIHEYSHIMNGVCFHCWGSGFGFESKPTVNDFLKKQNPHA